MSAVSSRTSSDVSGASHIRACCSAAPARSPVSTSRSSAANPAWVSSDHSVEARPGADQDEPSDEPRPQGGELERNPPAERAADDGGRLVEPSRGKAGVVDGRRLELGLAEAG